MPTVNIKKTRLDELLGHKFTQEEFEDLCFEFGIELDDVTSQKEMAQKEQGEESRNLEGLSDEIIYKIDTPANRYDLLSAEGITTALNVFLGKRAPPRYVVIPPSPQFTMTVKKSVQAVREFVVCAVLRDIYFTDASYASFIDFQEKLHQGLARKRTLASVGTHNLDKCQPPFVYEARPRETIAFIPLNQEKVMTCVDTPDGTPGLVDYYKEDRHISKYIPLIADEPTYPVISDTTGKVLSLPPIINSDYSKITKETTNIFIECTAPDHHKAHVLVNQLVCAFSMYSKQAFTVEGIKVMYEGEGATVLGEKLTEEITPNLANQTMQVNVEKMNSRVGINNGAGEMKQLLERMLFTAEIKDNGHSVEIQIPPTRSDVLDPCDVSEDIATAYGYSKIPMVPCPTHSAGYQTPMNKLTHLLRQEVSNAGYMEMLTLSLCSRDEAFKNLGREDQDIAVHIANPQTMEFQVIRPSLLPGTLKTLQANKHAPLPLKLFEISDVVYLDPEARTGCKNERHVCAVQANSEGSAFEDIHGLVEYTMTKIGVERLPLHESNETFAQQHPKLQRWYDLTEGADPAFFSGRCMNVVLCEKNEEGEKCCVVQEKVIGHLGVLHPLVLKVSDYTYPCSYFEMNLQPFL